MKTVLLGERLAKLSIEFMGFQRNLLVPITVTLAVRLA